MAINLSPLLYQKRQNYYRMKYYGATAHKSVNHFYDGKPYTVHLKMVHKYAKKHINVISRMQEYQIDIVLGICWLHDVIEDCRETYNDIKSGFGTDVAEIVYALSNEKGKNRNERANDKYYEGIRAIECSSFIKICDRLANIEYSKKSGSSMFEKYKKEYNGFREKLYSIKFSLMFWEMEELLGIKQSN